MTDFDELRNINFYSLTNADSGAGLFVIDGRDYPTSEAVVAAAREARTYLRRLGARGERITHGVRPTDEVPDLISWEQFKSAIRVEDAPESLGEFRPCDQWHTWVDAEAGLRERLPADQVARLKEVFDFAEHCHAGQTRPTGDPYTWHLLETLQILADGAGETDPTVLAAALLHDVAEDTTCTLEQIAAQFGTPVAELVAYLTAPPVPGDATDRDKRRARVAYLRQFKQAPREAQVVKLADRLSNVQHLDQHPRPEKQRKYYRETVTYFVPLALRTPWFNLQYAQWMRHFKELGRPEPGTPEWDDGPTPF